MKKILLLALSLTSFVGFSNSLFAQGELRPNDSVTVTPRGMPESEQTAYTGMFNIDSNGYLIGLPYLSNGEVRAAGLTNAELAQRITDAYIRAGIYTKAQFSVATANQEIALTRTLTIDGEVKTPKSVPYSEDMSLVAAIAEAGGKTDFASWKVEITRDGQTFPVDLRESQGANFRVRPGDYVSVWQQGITGPRRPN